MGAKSRRGQRDEASPVGEAFSRAAMLEVSEPRAVDLAPATPGFVLQVHDLLTREECAAIIGACEAMGVQPAASRDKQPRKGEAYLNRDSSRFVDARLTEQIWARVRPYVPQLDGRVPLGLRGDGERGCVNELRFYRYTKGQSFGLHVDQSWRGPEPGVQTEFTLLIYLNSTGEPTSGHDQPLVGGETVFMASAKRELARVTPRAGVALLHAHGRRCLMHESTEVQRGIKFVLRADVMFGPEPSEGSPAAAPTHHSNCKHRR